MKSELVASSESTFPKIAAAGEVILFVNGGEVLLQRGQFLWKYIMCVLYIPLFT